MYYDVHTVLSPSYHFCIHFGFYSAMYRWRNMILDVAIPEALVMTWDGATLEALVVVHICREVKAAVAAIAMVAESEGA